MTLRRRLFLKSLALLLAALPGLGCTRQFFRKHADKDVDHLLTEKNVFEPWRIENWHVYPDPRARFADTTNPDHPPMPPDDPAARFLSPNPQKPRKAGVGLYEGTGYMELLAAWDAMNRAENPPELKPIPGAARSVGSDSGVKPAQYVTAAPAPACDPLDKTFLIKLEQSCELGLINSREFQDQRENLYLFALPVSLQRYSFAAQFFAMGDGGYQHTGAGSSFPGDGAVGARKLFPGGATLLAQAANNFVFNIGGGAPQVSVSTLTLNLVQPLLRGGGLAVNLEPLTQAERNLLYQIRTYARFRKVFYVNTAGGQAALSATGGGLTAVVDPTSGAVTTVQTRASGYLPIVLQAGLLELDRQNVRQLEDFLRRYEAFLEGGNLSQLQVDQVKQQLLAGQITAFNDEQQLHLFEDFLKLQLGLPPKMHLDVDKSALRPMTDQLGRYQEVFAQVRAAEDLVNEKYTAAADAPKLRGRFRQLLTDGDLVKGTRFRDQIGARWVDWEKLGDDALAKRLAEGRDRRRSLLDERTRLETRNQQVPEELNVRIVASEADIHLGLLEQDLREYERQPWKKLADPQLAAARQIGQFRIVQNSFELVLIEARNQRFEKLRNNWPQLPRVCVEGVDMLEAPLETAYTRSAQVALTNRLDLMNTRGQLMDDWRQIAVRANGLLGVVNVGYDINSLSPPGMAKPLNFANARTNQLLTVHGELPLVRRLERNAYRTALINFQRGRRSLMATEDNILTDVRSDIRALRILATNYKIQQEQIAITYRLVENALETFSAPAQLGGPASDPVALTLQLLDAQTKLVAAQKLMLTFWINFATRRMTLYLDLELMPLDARGVWIDEHATRCDPAGLPAGLPTNAPVPPAPVEELFPAPRPAPEPDSVKWRARPESPAAAAKR